MSSISTGGGAQSEQTAAALFNQLTTDLMEAGGVDLVPVANQLPKEGMLSYEKDDKGFFKIVYQSAQEVEPSHHDAGLAAAMKGGKVKVEKVVTGRIHAANGDAKPAVEITAGVTAIKKIGFVTLPAAHLNKIVAVSETSFNVIGTMGSRTRGITASHILTQDQILLTKLDWNKA